MLQSTANNIVSKQRIFFSSGKSRDISFRMKQLRVLRTVIKEQEQDILEAIVADMYRPLLEAYFIEIGAILNDITFAIRNLKSWASPVRVRTPLVHFPASSYIYTEPVGVVLIIGSWNTFHSNIGPLIGSISAGNCAVLKPSEFAPNMSHIVAKIIKDNFDESFIAVAEGGIDTAKRLLGEPFDHIFFTGGTRVGRIVAEAAGRNLIPVTLELGGKNPCIVDRDVPTECTAKRIVWGKFYYAGQGCICVDYLLVHKAIKKQLLESMKKHIKEFYGEDPSRSPDFARIINRQHFDRLRSLLGEGQIITGGEADADKLYISPTLMDNVLIDSKIMQEEIFGPILPIIEYENLADAISFVNERPKPLALYFFSGNGANQGKVLRETHSGGGCINDTLVHATTTTLPFGGIGFSGMGNYHGKASFDTFSHKRSILKRSLIVDVPLRYPPYRDKIKLVRRVFGYVG